MQLWVTKYASTFKNSETIWKQYFHGRRKQTSPTAIKFLKQKFYLTVCSLKIAYTFFYSIVTKVWQNKQRTTINIALICQLQYKNWFSKHILSKLNFLVCAGFKAKLSIVAHLSSKHKNGVFKVEWNKNFHKFLIRNVWFLSVWWYFFQ